MLRITSPATADPVSLAEAKALLRVTDTSQDAMITALISAATQDAQAQTQRLFVTQTVEWVCPCWATPIMLPIAPVAKDGVNSIKYIDWSQVSQTLDPSTYVVQTKGPSVRIIPAFGTIWPLVYPAAPEPIVIQFVAGVAASAVPAAVKQAILLTVRHLYSMGSQNVAMVLDRVEGVGEKRYAFGPGVASLLPDIARSLLLSETW